MYCIEALTLHLSQPASKISNSRNSAIASKRSVNRGKSEGSS